MTAMSVDGCPVHPHHKHVTSTHTDADRPKASRARPTETKTKAPPALCRCPTTSDRAIVTRWPPPTPFATLVHGADRGKTTQPTWAGRKETGAMHSPTQDLHCRPGLAQQHSAVHLPRPLERHVSYMEQRVNFPPHVRNWPHTVVPWSCTAREGSVNEAPSHSSMAQPTNTATMVSRR